MHEILPLIPEGASTIANNLHVINENNQWTYYHGYFPVFFHRSDDKCSFRMITSSLIISGACRNCDIMRVFNVSKRSVIRNCKKYQEHGATAFFPNIKKKTRKKVVLTQSKLDYASELLSSGYSRSEVAEKLGVKYSTLNKAINYGRIKIIKVINPQKTEILDKSTRSLVDYDARNGIGVACTRTTERCWASSGLLNVAESCFEHCHDVSCGGVLIALPALIVSGLYYKIDECFREFNGYYSVTHVMTLLAFMALCRIKTVEQLRWQSPGELGKLLGLDRIPEVKCLREKLTVLSEEGEAKKWGELLSRKWMDDYTELSGVLYVDGHVRLYGGKEKLPKQYVSRERLCLRGMMDFWVNDMIGQPFFVIRTIVNPGMLQILRNDIVPRLLKEVPNQPTEQMLATNPSLHRFIIVFDREGYSPKFFKDMWQQHRIACMTYNKYPGKDWSETEFKEEPIKLINGETTPMKIAERGRLIGKGKDKVWVKEIRKLTKNNHQTSIITTAYSLASTTIAPVMFARWCQENFFNYMMQHFAIDLLSEYRKEPVLVTEKIISPEKRKLDKQINSLNGQLKSHKIKFANLTLPSTKNNHQSNHEKWQNTKLELVEEITIITNKLTYLKNKRKKTEKYIKVKDLPPDKIFQQPATNKKHLLDTIKMISYRAETAIASSIAKECGSLATARAILRDVFTSEADLIPDEKNKILTIRLHNLSTYALDQKLDKLLILLNDANVKYPGTNLTLHYTRIGANRKIGKFP